MIGIQVQFCSSTHCKVLKQRSRFKKKDKEQLNNWQSFQWLSLPQYHLLTIILLITATLMTILQPSHMKFEQDTYLWNEN